MKTDAPSICQPQEDRNRLGGLQTRHVLPIENTRRVIRLHGITAASNSVMHKTDAKPSQSALNVPDPITPVLQLWPKPHGKLSRMPQLSQAEKDIHQHPYPRSRTLIHNKPLHPQQ